MTMMPAKRHLSIQNYSREHHFALLLCWKIKKGLANGVSPERIKRYTDWFYQNHLRPHFTAEEKCMYQYWVITIHWFSRHWPSIGHWRIFLWLSLMEASPCQSFRICLKSISVLRNVFCLMKYNRWPLQHKCSRWKNYISRVRLKTKRMICFGMNILEYFLFPLLHL